MPTDIAAGLMLVEQQQKCMEENLSAIIISSTPSSQSATTSAEAAAAAVLPVGDVGGDRPATVMVGGDMAQNWMTVPMMAHYMKFALGSYGWPFYMYANLFTGLCRLCAACRYVNLQGFRMVKVCPQNHRNFYFEFGRSSGSFCF